MSHQDINRAFASLVGAVSGAPRKRTVLRNHKTRLGAEREAARFRKRGIAAEVRGPYSDGGYGVAVTYTR